MLLTSIHLFGWRARRSATECAAVLDICREHQAVDVSILVEGRDVLTSIVSMLIELIRSLEGQ
jgi:hypothetical protein